LDYAPTTRRGHALTEHTPYRAEYGSQHAIQDDHHERSERRAQEKQGEGFDAIDLR